MKTDLLHTDTYTRRSLVLCTAHIPESTDIALHEEKEFPTTSLGILSIDSTGHGWNTYISADRVVIVQECEILKANGFSELANLINLASENGFNWLVLDGDADCLPDAMGFPTFEW